MSGLSRYYIRKKTVSGQLNLEKSVLNVACRGDDCRELPLDSIGGGLHTGVWFSIPSPYSRGTK
jgi:hypothetical protein